MGVALWSIDHCVAHCMAPVQRLVQRKLRCFSGGEHCGKLEPAKSLHCAQVLYCTSVTVGGSKNSSRSLMTIWDRDAHAGVDLCVCARYVTTSQFSPRKFESNNDEGKLERFDPLEGWRLHKRKANMANSDMPCHWYFPGWQGHRLLHLDQGTSAALGIKES